MLLLDPTQVKQVIDSFEWMKMHHNCCSLSSLNYVLLAQEQVNYTSSVYCSDQPCHLNQRLTKERGNPQCADRVSQELANSNYVSKQGSRVNFSWCSVRLIKEAVVSAVKFNIVKFNIVSFRKGPCVSVWGLRLHRWWVRCLFLLGPSYLWDSWYGEKQITDGERQTHTAFATPAMRHGASLGTRSSSRRRVIPSLPHFPRLRSLGLLCWPMTHEVIPHVVRRLILFCFHFCSLKNVDPQVSTYKINLHRTPSLFLWVFMTQIRAADTTAPRHVPSSLGWVGAVLPQQEHLFNIHLSLRKSGVNEVTFSI